MILKKIAFASLTAGLLLPPVQAGTVAEFDFSRAGKGVIGGKKEVVIRTLSPYGRFRGDSALTEPGKTYPQNALDRKGEWKALRFGSAKEYITVPDFRFEQGKPFTIETWIYIYSPAPSLNGFLMDGGFGYQNGFRLTCVRAKQWAPDGWISLTCGDGKSSKSIFAKNGTVNTWHHVVITSTGDVPALYVDGIPAKAERPELTPEKFRFAKNTPLYFGGSPRGGTDMKTDFFAVTDQPMSMEEVKKRHDAGKTVPDDAREKRFAAVKMEIPKESQGYFKVGEAIPVTVSVPAELNADKITVNGNSYKPGEEITVKFDAPGLYEIKIQVSANGKTIRSSSYPAAAIPAPKNTALAGSSSLAAKTPAAYALGSRLSREVVQWSALEPKKGEYNWSTADRIMEWNRKKGVETVFCLTGIPNWAKIPRDLENYKKLWQLIFARYDLKYAEVWNAFRPRQSHCDPEIYKQLLAAAKSAAKGEDENIRILAGRHIPGREGYWKLLKDIPASYDIISAEYSSTNPADKTLAVLCSNKNKKPVWVTGGGYGQQIPGAPPVKWLRNEKDSASAEIRAMVLAFANGAQAWFASSGPDEYRPFPNAVDGRPGWKGVAYGVFHSLIGRGAVLKAIPSKPGMSAIRYENPDRSIGLIVFAANGKTEFDSPAEAIGLFGEKLGKGKIVLKTDPVYLPGISKL